MAEDRVPTWLRDLNAALQPQPGGLIDRIGKPSASTDAGGPKSGATEVREAKRRALSASLRPGDVMTGAPPRVEPWPFRDTPTHDSASRQALIRDLKRVRGKAEI